MVDGFDLGELGGLSTSWLGLAAWWFQEAMKATFNGSSSQALP